jgi:glycosyltransferase involved in cell wall biosynthesis
MTSVATWCVDVSQVSVVIPTYNRAARLAETLDRLAELKPRKCTSWEVLVVDNNSSDSTASVIQSRQPAFPVPLRYVFERAQGRSNALNAGIAATTSPVLAFIDDDVVVGDDWLDEAIGPLVRAERDVSYTGGPVRPIWEAQRPRWLPHDRADLWGTIAILDYGSEEFIFEDRRRVPLGANMAVHRSLIDRVGDFSPRLGRSGGTQLLGQEVPEFLARARTAGAYGLYVPGMVVDHHVPAGRLTKSYFRRWWFGKGRSRAELERMQPVTELGVDLTTVRHVAGMPLFMWRSAASSLIGWLLAAVQLDHKEQFRHELLLCYFAGYVLARQRGSLVPAIAQ